MNGLTINDMGIFRPPFGKLRTQGERRILNLMAVSRNVG